MRQLFFHGSLMSLGKGWGYKLSQAVGSKVVLLVTWLMKELFSKVLRGHSLSSSSSPLLLSPLPLFFSEKPLESWKTSLVSP